MDSVIWNQHIHMSVCSFWGREREREDERGREKNRQTEKKNFEQE